MNTSTSTISQTNCKIIKSYRNTSKVRSYKNKIFKLSPLNANNNIKLFHRKTDICVIKNTIKDNEKNNVSSNRISNPSTQNINATDELTNDLTKKSIYHAIISKDEETAFKLISTLDNVNLIYKNKSLLTHAILNDQEKIAIALLDKGASPDIATENELSPINLAIIKNLRRVTNKIFEIGFDYNQKSECGLTPLMLLSMSGQNDKIKNMLSKNVDINSQDMLGRTALMYASMRRKDDTINLLVNNGAIEGINDIYGKVASEYYASWSNGISKPSILTPKQGEAVNSSSPKSKQDITSTSSENPNELLIDSVKKGNISKVKEIIQNNPTLDINYEKKSAFKELDNATPLMYASLFKRDEIIKILIDNGADINKSNTAGFNPLKIATLNNFEQTAMLLKKLGANEYLTNQMPYSNHVEKDTPLTSIERIKASVIMAEGDLARKSVDTFFEKLEKVNHHEINAILALSALFTTEEKPLKLIFNLKKGISGSNLNPMNKTTNGKFDPENNLIFVSNLSKPEEAIKTFLHELTHKVRFSLPEKNFEELFYSATNSKNKFLSIYGNPSNLELYKYTVLQRTELGAAYQNIEKVLEENIADLSKVNISEYLNISNISQKEHKSFEDVVKPIESFFYKKMKPQIIESIYNHPNRKKILLSNDLKHSLKVFIKSESPKKICKTKGLFQQTRNYTL